MGVLYWFIFRGETGRGENKAVRCWETREIIFRIMIPSQARIQGLVSIYRSSKKYILKEMKKRSHVCSR